jgi:hypothetical protein
LTRSDADATGAITAASTGVAASALAAVATACCVSPIIAPIIVGVLGAGGAVWAAGLKPYGWWILGGALLCLVFGFWVVYRPRRDCAVGPMSSTNRWLTRLSRLSLWLGAGCWMAAVLLRAVLST